MEETALGLDLGGMAAACGAAAVLAAASLLGPPPSVIRPPAESKPHPVAMPQYPACFAPPDPSTPSAREMTVIRPAPPTDMDEAGKTRASGRYTPLDRPGPPSAWGTPMGRRGWGIAVCPLCARDAYLRQHDPVYIESFRQFFEQAMQRQRRELAKRRRLRQAMAQPPRPVTPPKAEEPDAKADQSEDVSMREKLKAFQFETLMLAWPYIRPRR